MSAGLEPRQSPPQAGATYVVVGRLVRTEGRKTWTTSGMYDDAGRLVARAQQARDDVQGAHAGADHEGAVRVHDLGQVALEVGSCRVAGACVVVLAAAAAGAGLLEGCRLQVRSATVPIES